MKRYLIFGGADVYAMRGGWNDLLGQADTLAEARPLAVGEWWQVVDTTTGEVAIYYAGHGPFPAWEEALAAEQHRCRVCGGEMWDTGGRLTCRSCNWSNSPPAPNPNHLFEQQVDCYPTQ